MLDVQPAKVAEIAIVLLIRDLEKLAHGWYLRGIIES
jgi:hypothetical protein